MKQLFKKQIVKNYVEVETSYCHLLEPRISTIRKCCFSPTTTLEDCRRLICGIAKSSKWTSKKVWFVKTINEIDDKKQLYFFVNNSINKAKDTIVETKEI